jgi:group II intron reverse transcriptase/maturase
VDWINLTGAKKVHSLIDKVYKRKNLEMAWEKVKENRGSGGVDGQTLEAFETQLDQQLDRLQRELKEDTYQPLPVRQHPIPKRDKPGEYRMLGIPAIYDRVCQQALLNRLEPIFEPIFDDASFGYRRGRSTKDALRKIWKEIQSGSEWIVDADLRDFFGSVNHEKLLTLVAQRVADGRVLRLIEAMLKAGSYGKGHLFPTERGTPQGGVVSPMLSNILLTPFDREMRLRGYQLTRYADDWVITCTSAAEARAAVDAARRILKQLGVELHPQKTRIVHVRYGFEFLGYKIKRGYLRGWRGYFGFCETPEVLIYLTRWVRLRLRAALWRQWQTPRRRRAALLALGVRPRLATNTAGSGRGPWYLARAKALSVGLSNAYFKSLGLPTLIDGC